MTQDLASRIDGFDVGRMGKPIIDISRLSVAQRIQLAEDLWDSLAGTPEVLELTELAPLFEQFEDTDSAIEGM